MLYWKRILCIVPVLLMVNASFAAQQSPPKPATPKPSVPQVVRAQKFELTDSKGNVKAVMATTDDGLAVIKLFDKEGKPSVLVDSAGQITIMGAEQKPNVVVGKTESGYGIGVYDSKGTYRAGLNITGDEPMFTLRDKDSNPCAMFFMQESDTYFALSDSQEDGSRVVLHVGEEGPDMVMTDTNGKVRSLYGLASDGSPKLALSNADEEPCLKLYVEDGLPALTAENPKNELSAFLGFVTDTDLAMMILNADNVRAAMALSEDNGPYISVAHPNGNPASTLGIDDADLGYMRTSDTENNALWRSP